MKRIIFIGLVLAVSCTSVREVPEDGLSGVSMSFNISIADLVTRTSYAAEGGALKCSWDAGDSVTVLSLKGGKVISVDQFTTSSGGRTAHFEGRYSGGEAETVVCVYPPLKGSQRTGYNSRRLPGAASGCFHIGIGDNCLTFTGSDGKAFFQASDADASHIAITDVMTGLADLSVPNASVTMTKRSDVLKVSASIPDLSADEKVRSMTLALSQGAPFAFGTATLPLASAGLWTAASGSSSLTINYGAYYAGLFHGLLSDTQSLTTYIPVLPLEGASALQGDEVRSLTITVRTDRAEYEAVNPIPARTGSSYDYPLTGGRLDYLTATLAKTSDVGVTTGTSEPDLGWVFFDNGPYTLETTVDALPGPASFELVRDLSLREASPDIVFSCQTTVGAGGSLHIDLGNLDPGFYQVRLRDTLRFMIGARPDALISPVDSKPDFDSFWSETFAQMDALPFDAEWTRVDAYSNNVRECYEIRYKSFGGEISGGILSIPVAAGKYPVKLKFMGYGNDHTYFPPNSNPGYIEFEVSVRRQGLFNTHEKWDCIGLGSKETYYYRGAFCDVKRAIDFVKTLEKADTDRMVAWGSSQGGALSTMAAALDPGIKALATSVPFLSDYPDYHKIATFPMNNDIFPAADAAGIPRSTVLDMLTYFDIKNFAPRIHCPVLMIVGLQDTTCPPHINFAMYNNLGTTDKQYIVLPTDIHTVWSNPITGQRVNAFLSRF